jgi:hypothetical protein
MKVMIVINQFAVVKTMDKEKGLLTGNENEYHDQWKKGRFFFAQERRTTYWDRKRVQTHVSTAYESWSHT